MTLRLTDAQVRWLKEPGDCFYMHKDRTGTALVKKGAIRIVEPGDSGYWRDRYELTDEGRAALEAALLD